MAYQWRLLTTYKSWDDPPSGALEKYKDESYDNSPVSLNQVSPYFEGFIARVFLIFDVSALVCLVLLKDNS